MDPWARGTLITSTRQTGWPHAGTRSLCPLLFVARWSYSTALHSLELANENNFDAAAQDAAFTIARVVRDLSPRHILMSNSFWGWWVESFWTDPVRGDLMDYSDKHWYANESGSSCDATGEACELISNVWDDSAAYVRECTLRFDEYRHAFGYDKPIVRGEGGVAVAATGPQHPLIAKDTAGIYYHKKLWAHVGTLGSTCDGEWYPNLAAEYTLGGESYDLYAMLAAYESFVEGEALSNGRFVEIGTDLTEGQRIAISQTSGALRAWGTQDQLTDRTLWWIDNANHTWARVASGGTVPAASGVLSLPGFVPGQAYQVEWWDPYATASNRRPVVTLSFATARADGTLLLSVDGLTRDVALGSVGHQSVPLLLACCDALRMGGNPCRPFSTPIRGRMTRSLGGRRGLCSVATDGRWLARTAPPQLPRGQTTRGEGARLRNGLPAVRGDRRDAIPSS